MPAAAAVASKASAGAKTAGATAKAAPKGGNPNPPSRKIDLSPSTPQQEKFDKFIEQFLRVAESLADIKGAKSPKGKVSLAVEVIKLVLEHQKLKNAPQPGGPKQSMGGPKMGGASGPKGPKGPKGLG